jgi:hypothetical protein
MKTIELPKSSDGRLSILVRLKNLVLSQLGQQAVTQLDGFWILTLSIISAPRLGSWGNQLRNTQAQNRR